ncbi:diacylglycerol kinase [Companilactobacillus sp. RD055328]|uniref:diacylglycerol kinase n=1 Tax=Companilactobacillus sp. RD055328 TaxID=2916634 RepID=UPI001FC8D451|nr:diacylglycerol kinase [Companilactobacillus sp. RD055328]GKQ43126.1 diacylglycerol kinase [Companilactobacillus sp. RD055328]
MRARLIYNPTSGHETMPNNVGGILNVLEEAGYEASAFSTTPDESSAKNEAKRAAKAGFELIVAAGGDGTINEVINGIAGLDKRPQLAIIPAGTTNDYARALKIPREDPIEAAKVVLNKTFLPMDIGKANDGYFMNIAAGGSMTELTYEVPSALKSILGYLAYLVKGAEMLPRMKATKMRIEYDDGFYEGEASMFFIAMTNSVGGMEQLVPDKQFSDGLFTLIVIKTSNLKDILHLIAQALNGGKHIDNDKIIYTDTRNVKVIPEEDEKLMINLDGEYGGDAPITFTNLQRHIDIFANTDELKNSISKDALLENNKAQTKVNNEEK